jgi:hypothetical protein
MITPPCPWDKGTFHKPPTSFTNLSMELQPVQKRSLPHMTALCQQLAAHQLHWEDLALDPETCTSSLNRPLKRTRLLNPTSSNILKRSLHQPYLYFMSTGLLVYLVDLMLTMNKLQASSFRKS